MDARAMFKLSYGLFIIGCEFDEKNSGCIINTAAQCTADPNTMLLTMMKSNNTTQFIRRKCSLTVSVISMSTPLERVAAFGMRSSRDVDKFADVDFKTDRQNNPYITDSVAAVMSLTVKHVIDLNTHYLFVCDVTEAEVMSDEDPMTYKDYRDLKAGTVLASDKPKEKKASYVCSICHYVYDGDIPFEELPDDYECPICHAPKSVFVKE